MAGAKQRLDTALVERGLAQSRERAQALVLSGSVYVGGVKADKSSQQVLAVDEIEVKGPKHPFVSRGALKLVKAFEAFGLDARGITAIDVGASTGGFTDVLLKEGALRVYAVDVGYGQLDWRLRNDPRVTVLERTNARYLTREEVPETPGLAVMDVAFISILKILPALYELLAPDGQCVCLIKPQFEAGREFVGKKGVVRDASVHERVIADILTGVGPLGFAPAGLTYSPITGPEGNIEFLLLLCKAWENIDRAITGEEIAAVVARAHEELRRGKGEGPA